MRMLRRALAPLALVVLVGLSTPAVVSAQDGDQDDQAQSPADERATAFRAVQGPQTEDVPGGALMVGAYAVVWVLVLLYVWRLGSVQAGLAREVDRLERSLAAAESKGDDEAEE